MSLTKREVKDFTLHYLKPKLLDKDWLLHDCESLLKIHDRVLLGVHLDRSRWNSMVHMTAFIRPLFWPFPAFAFGISTRVGVWTKGKSSWELDTESRKDQASTEIASVINAHIAPLFSELNTAGAILHHYWSRPLDPYLAWTRSIDGTIGDVSEILGFLCARSGHTRQARLLLRKALYSYYGVDESNEMRREIRKVQSLIAKPSELQEYLEALADQTYSLLKLDRARPL